MNDRSEYSSEDLQIEQVVLRLRGGGADNKRKEARKRKFANLQDDESTHFKDKAEPAAKKSRKQHSSPVDDKEVAISSEKESDGDEAVETVDVVTGDAVQQKPQRFIVFIGNLPYTTTDASLRTHFAKVQPTSIRHRTDKETAKSKGFAFLEFAAYDRMKTCLKLYHHSNFDDGESPARKINVELTVGGGGAKSKGRKTKLQAKNWKLSEERKRRAEEEAKAEKKGSAKKGAEKGKGQSEVKEKAEQKESEPTAIDNGDIHPSRRSRVSGK